MKYLSLMSVMLVAVQPLLACSDDDTPAPGAGTGGTVGSGGTTTGSGGTTTGSGGTTTGSGGTTTGSGGASTGGADAGNPDGGGNDIVETALAAGNFTKLAEAVTAADLVGALKGAGPFTVFAPSDAAFAAFEAANPGVLAGLTKAQLTDILKYHVVAGAAVESGDLKDEQVFVTLNGSPVLIDTTGGVKVDGATVTTADVEASNGVIHVIDTIMIPPKDDIVETAVAAGNFTTLAGALTTADLVTTLKGPGPFTVFAPTDAAFAKLAAVPTGDDLKNVLLYHVVSGAVGSGDLTAGPVPTLLTGEDVTVSLTNGVKINDANVTTANIITKNGVIHVVDTVLVPAN